MSVATLPERATALLMTPGALESSWRGAMLSTNRESNFDLALSDTDGQPARYGIPLRWVNRVERFAESTQTGDMS